MKWERRKSYARSSYMKYEVYTKDTRIGKVDTLAAARKCAQARNEPCNIYRYNSMDSKPHGEAYYEFIESWTPATKNTLCSVVKRLLGR